MRTSYMYRQLQHLYVSCGHFDDRHHSQKDGTTHIVHCTLIILTCAHSGQRLFSCITLSPVFCIHESLLFFEQFVLEVLKWCCRTLLFVKQVLEYTRVKLLLWTLLLYAILNTDTVVTSDDLPSALRYFGIIFWLGYNGCSKTHGRDRHYVNNKSIRTTGFCRPQANIHFPCLWFWISVR